MAVASGDEKNAPRKRNTFLVWRICKVTESQISYLSFSRSLVLSTRIHSTFRTMENGMVARTSAQRFYVIDTERTIIVVVCVCVVHMNDGGYMERFNESNVPDLWL